MQSKSSHPESPPRAIELAAILATSALMLSITGYTFMGGNHEVYLLEPLKRAGLATFEGDWFVNQTLQYHGLFAEVAAALYRLDVARPAFLVIFLGLLLTTAWSWWRIVRALGGDVVSFLVAVVLYHILLGDRALGFYSLLQDGQFNAGNVASVGLLVGIAMLLERRVLAAGIAFGVAGAFHLNYAVALPGIWIVLLFWERLAPANASLAPSPLGRGWRRSAAQPPGEGEATETSNVQRPTPNFELTETAPAGTSTLDVRSPTFDVRSSRVGPRLSSRGLSILATVAAVLPAAINIAAALPAKLQKRETMPFEKFVDLYVHLRHTHHYDPLAWPWWVWAAFVAPIPVAVVAWRRALRTSNIEHRTSNAQVPSAPSDPSVFDAGCSRFDVQRAWHTTARIWLLLIALLLFALLTSGVFWTAETFIQMSLWRFSPHAKLLAVSAVAVWLLRSNAAWDAFTARFMAAVLLCVGAVILLIAGMAAGFAPNRAVAGALAMSSAGLTAMRLATGTGGKVFALVTATVALAALMYAGAGDRLPPPGAGSKDAVILTAAQWARQNSHAASIFLLPPDASAFCVHARRGQVVSFKMVPQLSSELIEWDRRLREVLDVPDLMEFAGGLTGYFRAQEAMRRRYDELPSAHLFAVARKYGAQYVFRSAPDANVPESAIAWSGPDGAVLYDLDRLPEPEDHRGTEAEEPESEIRGQRAEGRGLAFEHSTSVTSRIAEHVE